MKNNIKVVILTESGENIGFGHLMRCFAIYDVFAQNGYKPILAINSNMNLDSFIEDRNYTLINWLKEKEKTQELLIDTDIAFIDSYLADEIKYMEIASIAKLSVYIDDDYRINYPKGIILNSLINANFIYKKNLRKYDYLLGAEFQTLRRDFWNLQNKIIKKEIDTILITLGGNDLRNLSETFLKAVNNQFSHLKKIFVLGSKYNLNNLNYLIDDNTELYQNLNTKEIIKLYQSADIAITAGGQSLIELAYVGVPSIVVCIADNQKNNIDGWQNANLIVNLGLWSEVNEEKIIAAINKLAKYETRAEINRIMKSYFSTSSNNLLINQVLKIYNKAINN